MVEQPSKKLDSKALVLWRIHALAVNVCIFGLLALVMYGLSFHDGFDFVLAPFVIVLACCALVSVIISVGVYPSLAYTHYRYDLTDKYCVIAKGIIFKQFIVIPFIRIQDARTKQGPLQRILGLASITVSTAAIGYSIDGIKADHASHLRDLAADYARRAREDV